MNKSIFDYFMVNGLNHIPNYQYGKSSEGCTGCRRNEMTMMSDGKICFFIIYSVLPSHIYRRRDDVVGRNNITIYAHARQSPLSLLYAASIGLY